MHHRGRLIGLLLVWTALSSLGPFTVAARAAFPGENGRIAFFADGYDPDFNDVAGIYGVTPEGEQARRLVIDAHSPRWSPSGTSLAYVVGYGSSAEIYIDGALLTSGEKPAWSFTGNSIVFVRDSDLFKVALDGTGLAQLTDNRANDDAPVWGRSGRIAFVRNGDIYTMNRNGDEVRRVTQTRRTEGEPDWSPNGRWLVYSRGNNPFEGKIFKMRLRDRTVRRLTRVGDASAPAWSPNGGRIVFTRESGDGGVLWTMRADGSAPESMGVSVLYSDEDQTDPDWQPLP